MTFRVGVDAAESPIIHTAIGKGKPISLLQVRFRVTILTELSWLTLA